MPLLRPCDGPRRHPGPGLLPRGRDRTTGTPPKRGDVQDSGIKLEAFSYISFPFGAPAMKNLLAFFCLLLAAVPVLAAPAAPAQRLQDVFHREWETRLREDPLYATYVGRHDYD